MTTKTHKKIDSKGHEEVWEWEETPALVKAMNEWKKTVEDGLGDKTKKVEDSE